MRGSSPKALDQFSEIAFRPLVPSQREDRSVKRSEPFFLIDAFLLPP